MALTPVKEAQDLVVKGVKPLGAELVAIENSLGRVLAKSVVAKRDQPPFAASAMDGYAVRNADVSRLPTTLKVIGMSAAGHQFKGKVSAGTAVRILTGAPVPESADTVIIQENTKLASDVLTVLEAPPPGKHIRRTGLDFQKDDELLAAGTVLRPRDIGLAAAGNAALLSVRKKPRVVLFATGDELVLPGGKARPDQIYSSNSHALAALAQQLGAEVVNLGIVRDSLKATIAAVKKGLSADILLTTGGASVGDYDFVQAAFKACGVKIGFWKIAMRPGKPFMYGRRGRTHVMGLPGNPVSALVTAQLFLKPLINAMLGLPPFPAETLAILGQDMPANDGREDYVRATLDVRADGLRTATPFAVQDSSMQKTMQKANCLIIRPVGGPAVKAGAGVPVLLLDL